VAWYEGAVDRALAALTPENHAQVAAIAALPDAIRGYERLKLESARRAMERAEAMLQELEGDSSDTARAERSARGAGA
jgi:indolepyruvate ferredoxin oxidoreductase